MDQPIFPQRLADGSFSVAIRYTVSDAAAAATVRRIISEWINDKRHRDQLDVVAELGSSPTVVLIDSRTMQIVLNCQPASTLWKGLLVELTRRMDGVQDIKRIGFWDLVTGLAHPASIEPDYTSE